MDGGCGGVKNEGIFPNPLFEWRPDENFCKWATEEAILHSRCVSSHSLGLGTSLIRKPPGKIPFNITVEFLKIPRFFLTVGNLIIIAADEHWVC